MISLNLKNLEASISEAAVRSGRSPADIVLVGVTKFADVPSVNEALRAGLGHIAENRVQPAERKFALLDTGGCPVVKHLIGHLQTNKARDAVRLFDLIQSVDSLKLVQEIDRRAAALNKVQDILVQLDIAGEDRKFGLPPGELAGLVDALAGFSNVRLRGLMTMAPLTADHNIIRSVFKTCREYFEEYRRRPLPGGGQMRYLSMGMSGDYVTAIEEGANMVRIGSAIFKGA